MPSHSSASVGWVLFKESTYSPTAVQLVALGHATLLRYVLLAPVGLATFWKVQADPSHCSANDVTVPALVDDDHPAKPRR